MMFSLQFGLALLCSLTGTAVCCSESMYYDYSTSERTWGSKEQDSSSESTSEWSSNGQDSWRESTSEWSSNGQDSSSESTSEWSSNGQDSWREGTSEWSSNGQVYSSESTSETMSKDVSCYTQANGEDYRGNVSKTRSGYSCSNWKNTGFPTRYPESGLGDHNYCRNPTGANTVWCFTSSFLVPWEECEVGERWACDGHDPECYTSPTGEDYRGTHSTTELGYPCISWLSPKLLYFHLVYGKDTGIGNHKHCRNPGGARRPWCFISNDFKWDYCNVTGHLICTGGNDNGYDGSGNGDDGGSGSGDDSVLFSSDSDSYMDGSFLGISSSVPGSDDALEISSESWSDSESTGAGGEGSDGAEDSWSGSQGWGESSFNTGTGGEGSDRGEYSWGGSQGWGESWFNTGTGGEGSDVEEGSWYGSFSWYPPSSWINNWVNSWFSTGSDGSDGGDEPWSGSDSWSDSWE